MGNIFNNGQIFLKLIVRIRIYHILIYRAISTDQHLRPHTFHWHNENNNSLDAKTQHNCQMPNIKSRILFSVRPNLLYRNNLNT